MTDLDKPHRYGPWLPATILQRFAGKKERRAIFNHKNWHIGWQYR